MRLSCLPLSLVLLASGLCAGLALPTPARRPAAPSAFVRRPAAAEPLAIPTVRQSAVLARRILRLATLGTLATVFPPAGGGGGDAAVAGVPIALMDYVADCEAPSAGNPTLLAVSIATEFRNAAAGSNVSLALRWEPPRRPSAAPSPPPAKGSSSSPTPLPYSAAAMPRFSLLGHLEPIETGGGGGAAAAELASCFTAAHPDARHWLPGNRIHRTEWMRLVVDRAYWVGGFGDRAYIGWIPAAVWRGVSDDEITRARLPGEEDAGGAGRGEDTASDDQWAPDL